MEVTVLGCGAAYPRAGGATAGFLVQQGDTAVWLEAGNGTFARLQEHIDFHALNALILSHAHADHMADVLPLMYALGFDPERPYDGPGIPMYAGKDMEKGFEIQLRGTTKETFARVFDMRWVGQPFDIGPIHVEAFETDHPGESYGMRMESGGKVFVYTSDTAWFDDLPDRCRDADLLLSEATWAGNIKGAPVHMWAREAGKLARLAGAKQLVLTHVWPTIDTTEAVKEAQTEYDGPIEAAVEGARYTV